MEKFADVLNVDLDTTINYLHHSEVGDNELFAIGCELSEFDGEHVMEMIGGNLHDKVVVSTCAVTESCKKACEVLVELLHFMYAGKKDLLITGCGVNYDRSFFEKYGKTLDNSEKFKTSSYELEKEDKNHHSSKSSCPSGQVKIQDGCNHNCSYCVIPKLKGKSYSIDYETIKSWISEYISRGIFDIRLIGTEVGYYFSDGMNLTHLVKRILKDFPMIKNLSFNAIDPASDQIFDIIELARSDRRVSNKIELSVQSASDDVLERMNRRHDVARLFQIQKFSGDDVFFKWHLIVGFPGERDAEFEETIGNILALKPYSIAINPYSDRKGTIAEKMGGKVPEEVIEKRCEEVHNALLSYNLGKKMHSLVEEERWQIDEKSKFTKAYDGSPVFDISSPHDVKKIAEYLEETNAKTVFLDYGTVDDDTKFEIYTRFLMEKFDVSFTCIIDVDENLPGKILGGELNLKKFVLNKNVLFRFRILEDTTKTVMISLVKALKRLGIYSSTKLLDDIRHSGRTDLIDYFS